MIIILHYSEFAISNFNVFPFNILVINFYKLELGPYQSKCEYVKLVIVET